MDPTDLFQSTGPAGSDHARSSTHPRKAGLVDSPPQRLQTRFAEHKFFTLTETVPAVIFIHRNGRFVYINSAAQEMLGYSREEFLRMNFWEVVHPDCRDWVRARGLKRQQGETPPTRYELKAITKNGEPLWLDCSATRIDYQGEPAVLGCCFDITERLQAQEALRESEERFRTLCEAAPIGIAMHDVQGTLLHTNLAYQRMLGYSGEELRQLGLQPITHPDDLAEERRLFVDLRKG